MAYVFFFYISDFFEYSFNADVYLSLSLKKIVDIINSFSPSPLPSHKLQTGFPEINQVEGGPLYMFIYDNSKQDSILGIKFRGKLETAKDMLEDFSKRGW